MQVNEIPVQQAAAAKTLSLAVSKSNFCVLQVIEEDLGTRLTWTIVLKDKRGCLGCFSQGEWSAVQLLLDHAFALRIYNDIWNPALYRLLKCNDSNLWLTGVCSGCQKSWEESTCTSDDLWPNEQGFGGVLPRTRDKEVHSGRSQHGREDINGDSAKPSRYCWEVGCSGCVSTWVTRHWRIRECGWCIETAGPPLPQKQEGGRWKAFG